MNVNKKVLDEEFIRLGITMNSFDFTKEGYHIEIQMSYEDNLSWGDIDRVPLIGLELVRFALITPYTAKTLFLPSNHKEFVDYVRKHIALYNRGKQVALKDLKATIDKNGTKTIKRCAEEFFKKN